MIITETQISKQRPSSWANKYNVQAVVRNGTFGDLEEQTNALQVILDCFGLIKEIIFKKKKC